MMRSPIVMMSFNRPQFLEPVLASLMAQREALLEGREIHLFQDGAVNRYSRIRYAKDADIDASIDAFRNHFPHGTVHHSADNIGICENYRRAERYLFEEREVDVGYFLEDDLVLSPVYLEMMDRISTWAVTTPNVAYFAAYGDYYSVPENIAALRRELVTLDHHWGFGLVRRHWRKMQPLLEPFYDIVCGNDYSRRDHRRIYALYESFEAAPRASSQDAAKAFACDRLGLWRANTVVPFAKYIGNIGQHMTPEAFNAIGYDRTVVSNEAVGDLKFPDKAQIERRLAEQRAIFSEIRQIEFSVLVEALPARKYNPLRPCERNDVSYGYQLFLNREPPSEDLVQMLIDRKTVFELVSDLVATEDFQRLNEVVGPPRICSRDDVYYAYRLCLHRDPDNERVFEEHVGKHDARLLTRDIWNGPERHKVWASVELPV
jgi:hypothetical protein